jgi:arginine:ornithine antiporter/lysine permease
VHLVVAHPYLLAAGYALRISPGRHRELIIALLATVYTAFLVIAAGIEYVLLSCIVYAPGTLLFVRARREQEATVFTAVEKGLVVVVVAGAAVGVAALATGWITI